VLDAGHNPGGDQRLDKRLQFVEDGAYRIKGRPLFEMDDLWNDPARQESESREDADENEQAPTGAQAPGVEEKFPHVVGTLNLKYSFLDFESRSQTSQSASAVQQVSCMRKLAVDESRANLP